MSILNLGCDRHLCWDNFLIDRAENAEIKLHKPERKEIILSSQKEWEGIHNGYASIMKVGDKFRFYYRSMAEVMTPDGYKHSLPPVFCVAESYDGINFKRPKLGIYDINGGKDNNIVYCEYKYVDNFSIFYDENPDCPENEKFKALKMDVIDGEAVVYLHKSADGYHFDEGTLLDLKGEYDTFNVIVYDKETAQYFIYFRGYHAPKYKEDYIKSGNGIKIDDSEEIRDIRVATTKDFKTFDSLGEIQFIDDKIEEDIQYYTNQIIKYPRAKDMYLGIPTRYIDRKFEKENFEEMPLWGRRAHTIEKYGRGGTALTDCILMTSRDGINFNRTDESFLTPGPECDASWWYGDCYTCYGLAETESDIEGAPNEFSLYMGEGYQVNHVNFRRYTIRLDGFFSWYAKYEGGNILTKPFTFEGNELEINFASAAYGGIQIAVCDADGNEIEGYKSIMMFGDSVSRKVSFEKSLKELHGKAIRLKILLRDANLYSFRFYQGE